MTWAAHVTVAAIIDQDQRFLLVEEMVNGTIVINQPAGHLEQHETLSQAVARETLEETAWQFTPSALVGIYLWNHTKANRTYMRVAFTGEATPADGERLLDEAIIKTLWLSRDELAKHVEQLRSPMVLRCIDDYLNGQRYSLSLLSHLF